MWALLLPLAPLLPGQTCPPVTFLNLNQIRTGASATTSGGAALIRQPDGTFSAYRGTGRPPAFTFNSITPNFQQNLYACSPLANRPHRGIPGRPNFLDNLPGTGGRNPLVVDFLGDSTSISGFAVDYLSNLRNGVTLVVANADGSLRSTTTAASGTSPDRMVVADFNGDGRRDLAILNSPITGSGSIAVYLGNGTATLPAPATYATGTSPLSITTADLNSDNRPDLAIIDSRPGNNSDRYISVYLNNGSGAFGAPVSTFAPGGPLDVIAADVTGDGRLDLVTGGSPIAVFPGNADGTFRAPLFTPVLVNPFYIAAGDFNKDGRIDIAGSERTTNGITIYLNSGGGVFSARRTYSLGDPSGASEPHLLVTDFDGDTWPDVVMGTGHPDALAATLYGSAVRVLINRGDGTGSFFGAPIFRTSSSLLQPAVGDFNGDGNLDLITSANNGIGFLAGTGSGFQDPVPMPVLTHQSFTQRASAAAAGDFNNDGRLDAAVFNGAFTVLLGNGNGSFLQSATRIAAADNNSTRSLAAGDLNGDNRLDLVAAQERGNTPLPTQVRVFLGNGDGTLQNPVNVTLCANPVQVRLADLNADGRLDLVATCSGISFGTPEAGGVGVALGNGNGTFQAAVVLPAGANPDFTSIADITGDNRPDLITSTTQPGQLGGYQIALHFNQGNGTFQSPVLLATDFGPAGHAIADFTGDGKPDILAGHCCGDTDIGLYVGNGNGTFQAERPLGLGEASFFAPGDYNNDGKLDLLVTRSGTDAVTLLFNGAGTIPTEACTFTLSRTSAVAAASGDALGFLVRPSGPACTWTASTTEPWLTISNAQRTGGGAILVSAAANPTAAFRTGSAIIAGLPVTITQYPTVAACSFSVNPQSFTFGGDSAFAEFAIQTGAACEWSARSSAQWLSASTNGAGPRTSISIFAAGNSTGTSRAATIDVAGLKIQAIQRAFNPVQIFTDVPLTDPFFNHITLIRGRTITSGCTASAYCPGDIINRGQMAVFLVRSILGTESFNSPGTPFFTDVPAAHPFFRYIQKLRELNVTSGCGATTYCPDDPVTRGQMAAFLIRASLGLAPGAVFPFPATPFFTDVPASNPFFSFVQLMRGRGITAGCSATGYCPNDPVTRGQMAVFLVRGLLAE